MGMDESCKRIIENAKILSRINSMIPEPIVKEELINIQKILIERMQTLLDELKGKNERATQN